MNNNHISKNTAGQWDLWDKKFALPNASCLERDAAKLLAEESPVLICLDIVSLRTINGGYGREVGDMLLRAVRDWILSLHLGQLYRLESDEFALMLTGVSLEETLEKAQYIYERFREPWDVAQEDEARQVFCGASVGIVSGETISSADEILNAVERILKIASKQGEIAVYDEEMGRQLKRSLEMEINLKSCVKNSMQGFGVHYQPIVNCITGLWCGVEALCRWLSPSLGSVPALDFIPVAEQLGLIGMIGEWVLEASVKQCKEWGLHTHEDFFLDINLSPIQLMDKRLDLKILDILKRNDFPTHKLSLEITESSQLNFNNHTLETISRLTQQGIPVALDDFGTGYSSFHSLVNLPVSVLKTEKSLLNNIENNEYLQQLLETMVSLAHASGMKLTAEGVENGSQMKMLMDNRVDYVQGFLFSKPLPAEEFKEKLGNFYRKEENSIVGEYRRIDVNALLSSGNTYSLTPSLYKTLIHCMEVLFANPEINDGIDAVFALIGKKLNVNRLTLFLRDPKKNTFTNTHEWCDENTKSNIGLFTDINIRLATPSFIPLFEKEGMIVSPDISILPEDIRKMFQGVGIKSNIAIPLWRGKELLGFVGLDMLNERRNWLPEEALMVHSVCGILANILDKIYLHEEIAHRQAMLNTVLNNTDILVFVSDLETDEILFTNTALRKRLGANSPLEGNICWQTLYKDKTSRCEFCKVPQLLENPAAAPIAWEHVHEIAGRRCIVYDSIIQWKNEKKAHIQYAIDITRFSPIRPPSRL